jgi:hypothetical protein
MTELLAHTGRGASQYKYHCQSKVKCEQLRGNNNDNQGQQAQPKKLQLFKKTNIKGIF